MKLYNSLSQTLETVGPLGDPVSLYVCGITPYDTTHLGHAFTYTTADVLVRYLEFLGHTVRYVQNVTDIDDDILRKAREVGEDWRMLGDRWTVHFMEDMKALNVRPPDWYPRASDVIPDILGAVEQLVAQGVAYEAGGSVYYDIAAWPDYGKLCCLSLDEMLPIANERGNRPDDPNKRHPLDFVLWQAQAPGEPAWESPWGPGRPGWHIECSTMATRFLGETIDFHLGGADLLFPHHESEIAQVEPITGKQPFARFWVHIAMVQHEGEKMSKSLGNLVMVQDLLTVWSPDTLRGYLASHHYREPWSFAESHLNQAQGLVSRLAAARQVKGGEGEALSSEAALAAFRDRLDDDLDTPGGLGVLDHLADQIITAAHAGRRVWEAQKALVRMAAVLGLRPGSAGPEERVVAGWDRHRSRFSPAG